MYKIFTDDVRAPIGHYDVICRTPKVAINAFQKKYDEGERKFFLEMDHDSGIPGHDFIDLLTYIESNVHLGKMKNLDVQVHIHTGNAVGRSNLQNIIKANSAYMYEVEDNLGWE